MKLMSFTKNGVAGFGAVQGDSVVDFSCKYPDLKSFLSLKQNVVKLGSMFQLFLV